ncbi:hypothetical protein [Streptomyces sp. NPDC005283]|uniref:hypothetical protein n=1 Tax=Streptomyces sp. NPDC005283 TaxID=3156871 RepID=UPI0034556480
MADLVPGLGESADGANCAWYGAEGDALNADLALKFGKWDGVSIDRAHQHTDDGSRIRPRNPGQVLHRLRTPPAQPKKQKTALDLTKHF